MSVGFMKNFPIERAVLARVLAEVTKDPTISKEDLMRAVGIGSTKAEAYKRLLLKLNFLDRREITPLAHIILDFDPFIQSETCMWIIHYKLCSNPEAEVWYNVLNGFLPDHASFSFHDVLDFLLSKDVWSQSNQHLRSDLSIFLRSYISEDSLAKISFLQLDGFLKRNISQSKFRRGISIKASPALISFVIFDQMRRKNPGHNTITIRELLTLDENVGKVFSLDRQRLMNSLKLASSRQYNEVIAISTTAGLDQVVLKFDNDPLEILKVAFAESIER